MTKRSPKPNPSRRDFLSRSATAAGALAAGACASGGGVQEAQPDADFIVGNPPFIGKGERMREALGDGYAEALHSAYPEVPESGDFVMHW